jgi:integrase
MSALRTAVDDYLAMRRALGFKLEREGTLLPQFVDFVADRGEQHVTVDAALAWARLPASSAALHSRRLGIVRGFAAHMHSISPVNELIAVDLLPSHTWRGTPYIYSQAQIDALIAAAQTLRTPLRVATMQTLLGLLAVTGMRIGEVTGLDRGDFDAHNGFLLVRGAKFGKSRELPLHPSTVQALGRYLRRADRPAPAAGPDALLLTSVGTRLRIGDVQRTFVTLRRRVGIETNSPSRQPRLHDIRHSFAVATITDAYASGENPGHTLALLATYLGHVSPASTYWYLSASPELMQQAAGRLERHTGQRP